MVTEFTVAYNETVLPHYMFNVILSATITLSSHGAEVRGASLVPFYCSLGIKSGSGAYSEKKSRRDMNYYVFITTL